MRQAVLEIGRSDLDEIRELEAALERARGDTVVQIFALVLVLGALAGDRQLVLLGVKSKLVLISKSSS